MCKKPGQKKVFKLCKDWVLGGTPYSVVAFSNRASHTELYITEVLGEHDMVEIFCRLHCEVMDVYVGHCHAFQSHRICLKGLDSVSESVLK
jgi:hypothetical protein